MRFQSRRGSYDVPGAPRDGYDAALHLLDRQIIDADGRLVGKVDDIELTEEGDALVPTGLMVGLGAWLPRLGRRVGPWVSDRYRLLSVSHALRRSPSVVDLDRVDHVDSAVHLVDPRAGLLFPRIGPAEAPVRHRLGDLMGMRVVGEREARPATAAWPRRPRVIDVRLAATSDDAETDAVSALVVGGGRPGALLGYDRARVNRPWLVAAIIGRLHRHSVVLACGGGVEIDWADRVVRVAAGADVHPLKDLQDDAG